MRPGTGAGLSILALLPPQYHQAFTDGVFGVSPAEVAFMQQVLAVIGAALGPVAPPFPVPSNPFIPAGGITCADVNWIRVLGGHDTLPCLTGDPLDILPPDPLPDAFIVP